MAFRNRLSLLGETSRETISQAIPDGNVSVNGGFYLNGGRSPIFLEARHSSGGPPLEFSDSYLTLAV
jgi:16S rRNA U516 pseudouridylate synthase RsuA-like enzyme